jgi:hypothetical protein
MVPAPPWMARMGVIGERSRNMKQELLFLKKKKQKDFYSFELTSLRRRASAD